MEWLTIVFTIPCMFGIDRIRNPRERYPALGQRNRNKSGTKPSSLLAPVQGNFWVRLKQHFLFFLFTSIIKFLCREDRLIQCWMNLWLNHGISLTNISHSPGMTAGPNMSYITFSVCTAIENSNWIVGRSTTCCTDYSKLVTCDHWTTITSFRSSSNNATSILRLHLEENAL